MWHKEHILSIHRQHPYYGYKHMTRALAREGMVMNHKRVRRLMRELDHSKKNVRFMEEKQL